jgi:hypothetical protein
MFAKTAQKARDCSFAKTADGFGLTNVVSLLLVRRFITDGVSRQEVRLVSNLILKKASPSTFAPTMANDGTEAREDEFIISGIPRNVDFGDWLQATGTSYWVNAEMRDGRVFGGTEVEFVTIDENNPLVYILTVRKKPDERRFN